MKNKHIIVGLIIVVMGVIASYLTFAPAKAKPHSIAIFMTLSHPSLERVRAGFISAMQANSDLDFKLVDYNAEGNVQQANLIAQQIAQDKNNFGVFAIGTLAAQTMVKIEKEKPIVFAAVSDPAVVVPDNRAHNVSGLTDTIDASFQIETLLDLLPQIKSISLLYSLQETNAASSVEKLKAFAQEKGLKVEIVGIHEPQQINSASLAACEKSDAVVIPLDNQLASAMPSVMRATRSLPCPVVISDEALIHHGAAIAFGLDYRKSGEEAASFMIDFINNKTTPKDIGFINPKQPAVYVNRRVAREKGLIINASPRSIINNVEAE